MNPFSGPLSTAGSLGSLPKYLKPSIRKRLCKKEQLQSVPLATKSDGPAISCRMFLQFWGEKSGSGKRDWTRLCLCQLIDRVSLKARLFTLLLHHFLLIDPQQNTFAILIGLVDRVAPLSRSYTSDRPSFFARNGQSCTLKPSALRITSTFTHLLGHSKTKNAYDTNWFLPTVLHNS